MTLVYVNPHYEQSKVMINFSIISSHCKCIHVKSAGSLTGLSLPI
jgi:hypothetical protein